jgi:hypothetical protein
MTPYVVRQGDHLAKLALQMGFDPDDVWSRAENDELRKTRPSWHILCAGDVIYLPEPTDNWLTVSTGQTNTYEAKVITIPVSVTFTRNGQPLANESCDIPELPDLGTLTTDGGGALKFEVPVDIEAVTVNMPGLGIQRRLLVGHLDPSTTESGALQRLRNLGYVSPDDTSDLAAMRAIQRYQHVSGLPITGQVDDATAKQLESDYGC